MFSSRPKAASFFNLQKVTISPSSWTPPFPPIHISDRHQICIIPPQKLPTLSFSNSITKTLTYAFITSHLQWSPVRGTEPNPRQTLLFQNTAEKVLILTKPLKHITPTFTHLHWFHVKFASPVSSSSPTEPTLLRPSSTHEISSINILKPVVLDHGSVP